MKWAMGTAGLATLGLTAAGVALPIVPALLCIPVAGGAGIGPDADHDQATIAHTHWFLSRWVTKALHAWLGHRGPTHWLFTGLWIGALVGLAGWRVPAWALGLTVALCGAWAARLLLPWKYHDAAAPGAAVAGALGAWWVTDQAVAPNLAWLGLAVAWGWCAHPVADALASEHGGVPLLGLPKVIVKRLSPRLRRLANRRFGWHVVDYGGKGEDRIAWFCLRAAIVSAVWLVLPVAWRTVAVEAGAVVATWAWDQISVLATHEG